MAALILVKTKKQAIAEAEIAMFPRAPFKLKPMRIRAAVKQKKGNLEENLGGREF